MKGNYEPDTFTENDVLQCLERGGFRYKRGNRYILSQCPTHDDKNPSVQIYKDDWFVNCHAGCGRFHITKAFPELRSSRSSPLPKTFTRNKPVVQKREEVKYKDFNLFDEWEKMPLIPRDHNFKGLPLEDLDELGWRWDETKESYFIPYFDRSKEFIPFAQWRHLKGNRRFTFLKDAKPIVYGLWNLDEPKLFIAEGASDAAVLYHCDVPCVAMPSAASGELLKAMAVYCTKNDQTLVYGGDNDLPGEKLREALDEVAPYRVKQPPEKYKDWGEFFEAEGQLAIQTYCFEELFPSQLQASITSEVPTSSPLDEKTAPVISADVENILEIFPGADELKIVGPEKSDKEQQLSRPTVSF